MSENEKKENSNSFSLPAKNVSSEKTTVAPKKAPAKPKTSSSDKKAKTTSPKKTTSSDNLKTKPIVQKEKSLSSQANSKTSPKPKSVKQDKLEVEVKVKPKAQPKQSTTANAKKESTPQKKTVTAPKAEKTEDGKKEKDLSLLSSKERISILSGGKTNEKKINNSSASPSERVSVEKIKKTQSERKEKEKTKAIIPEVGHRNEKKSKTGILLYIALIILIIILAMLVFKMISERREKNTIPQEHVFNTIEYIDLEIKGGMSATQVAEELSRILDKDSLISYLVTNNLEKSIQPGTYRIDSKDATVEKIASQITQKAITTKTFNNYAGYTIEDIDSALFLRGLADGGDFIQATKDIEKNRNLSFREGWFLSGVYEMKDSAKELAFEMHQALLNLIREEAVAVGESGLSVDEIVIISSMINRETKDAEQMKTIAAIILNRYFAAMPLGIDATTRYEINNWTDKIDQAIYEKDTPYNTRRKPGLPPSGIGSSSKESILAVLYPLKTDAMYYLHSKDGKLYTALTYAEHLENFEKYGQK